MTAIRLIPLPVHAALRMASGLLMMVVPFALGLSAAAAVVGVLVGAVVAGVSLYGVPGDREQPALPVATLHAFDWGTVIGVFGAAAVLGLGGDSRAAAAFTVLAAIQLAGNLTTRYSARG